jgi:hypothetical protein
MLIMKRKLSPFVAAPMAAALAAGLTADAAPRPVEIKPAHTAEVPATTPNRPSAAILATGQYACKLVNLEDLHRQPANASDKRDELRLTLELTPNPDMLGFLKDNPDGKLPYFSWKSPSGTAFRRLPAPLPEQHQARQIGGNTHGDVFHDDNSPTGDDLNPTFTLTPNEAQSIGAIDDIYIKSEVSETMPDSNSTVQTIGYTLCGSIRHDGPREWSQVPSDAAAIPSFMTVKTLGS